MKYPRMTYAVAVAILLAFAAFTWWLIHSVGTTDLSWTRLAWVYGIVQAVVVAAAGVIFGTATQIERVKAAQEGERNAKAERALSASDAAVGQTLEAMIVSLLPQATSPDETGPPLKSNFDWRSASRRYQPTSSPVVPRGTSRVAANC